jgi:uncharacterized membrane protein YhaH (DUF805 family)
VNYPLMDVFWTILWFFVWVLWLFLVAWTILNIFRRHDLASWGKAGWVALVILLPFIGVFAYLIVHGGHLAERQVEEANAPQDEAGRAYERWEAQGHGGGR